MTENRLKLINVIATRLSEEACERILRKIGESAPHMAFAVNKEWEEELHPRDNGGRFSSSGSLRGDMKKSEASKWDRTGKMTPNPNRNPKLKELKSKIDRTSQRIEIFEEIKDTKRANECKAELVRLQREYAEGVREFKHGEREKIESSALKRIMKRKAEKFRELEDEIDYIQESYGDNELGGPLNFPKGKRGEKIKADYERMMAERDKLAAEIDWDVLSEDED